jgi:hypothetical protein
MKLLGKFIGVALAGTMAGQLGWAAFRAPAQARTPAPVPPAPATPARASTPPPAPVPTFSVVGSIQGLAITEFGVPDRGGIIKFAGQGRTNLSVNTALIGWQVSPGFVREGLCRGELQLMTARGTVTLAMTSAEAVPGFSPCPTTMHWTVRGGRGAYAHKVGKGCVDSVIAEAGPEIDAPRAVTMAFRLWRHGQCYPSPPSSASR